MSIATLKPTSQTTTPASLPIIQAPVIKSIVSDDKYIPRESLISFVDGSPYSVTYYKQVLAAHSELRGHDAGQNAIQQQYIKIKQLEIKVITPLSGSPEEETSTTLVTGSANITPPLVPNVGDMFIASIGDGNEGLFEIKESVRKSMNHDAIYTVDYVLNGRVSNIPERIADLESKVNQTVYYFKDKLLKNGDPLILDEEYRNIQKLRGLALDIIEHYFKSFFNNEFTTLTVPGQLTSIYDKFVTETLMKNVDAADAKEIIKVKLLITDNNKHLDQATVWDALMQRDAEMLPFVNTKMGLVTTRLFSNIPIFQSIRFTGIQYIVFPYITTLNPQDFLGLGPEQANMFDSTFVNTPVYSFLQEAPAPRRDMSELLKRNTLDEFSNIPLIKTVLCDEYYIFSEAFYRDIDGKSILEAIVMDYIKGKPLDVNSLFKVAKRFKYWGELEQFYYLPVIIILINGFTMGG